MHDLALLVHSVLLASYTGTPNLVLYMYSMKILRVECLGNVSVYPLNAGWGRIINIASSHGLVASPNKAAYVASKFGLNGLTKVGYIAICSLKLK